MMTSEGILCAMNRLEELAGEGKPVSMCVADIHGFVLGYRQMQGMSPRGFAMARAKAHTAACMGVATSQFHERLVREQLSLADFGDDLLTSVPGGVPVIGPDGQLWGGVAVAGRLSEEDEMLARRLAEILAR